MPDHTGCFFTMKDSIITATTVPAVWFDVGGHQNLASQQGVDHGDRIQLAQPRERRS